MDIGELQQMGKRLMLTLLFGDSEKTISECTLRLLRRSFTRSLIALKHAASTWFLEETAEASRKAYSKSVLPSRSCRRRNAAFLTF